jgi:hypothetical protein
VDEIARLIVEEFQVAPDVAARDVSAFVEQLLAKGPVTAAS